MREHDLVLARQRVELVLRGDEFLAGKLGYLLRNEGVKSLRSVEPCADRRAAESEGTKSLCGEGDKLDILFEGRSPAAYLLRKFDRRRILKVGASALDDALILRLEADEGFDEGLYCGDHAILERAERGDVHRGREGVV